MTTPTIQAWSCGNAPRRWTCSATSCARARNGGRIALVAGEAGIGKSALVNEFARRCGPRARVLWGACDRLVTPRALGPLHDIGHQIGGRLAARLRSAAPQEEIFAAFLDELSASRSSGAAAWWWSRTRTGPTRRRWTGWPSWAAGSIGCRRCCSSPTATTRWDPTTRCAACWPALPSAVVRRVPLEPLSRSCVTRAGPPGRPRRRLGLPARRRQPVAGHRAAEGPGRADPRRGAGPDPRPDPRPAPAGPRPRPAGRGGADPGRSLR